jgi:hypothetical protein
MGAVGYDGSHYYASGATTYLIMNNRLRRSRRPRGVCPPATHLSPE